MQSVYWSTACLGHEKRKASPLWENSFLFVTNGMYGGMVVLVSSVSFTCRCLHRYHIILLVFVSIRHRDSQVRWKVNIIAAQIFNSKTRTTTRTRFSQYLVACLNEPASFWRENAIAVISNTGFSENDVVAETSHSRLPIKEGRKEGTVSGKSYFFFYKLIKQVTNNVFKKREAKVIFPLLFY